MSRDAVMEEIAPQMCANPAHKCRVTPAEARISVASKLRELVSLESRNAGGRERAVSRIARAIGASHAWIDRVLADRPGATIHLHLALSIEATLDRAIQSEINRLQGGANAALAKDHAEKRSGADRRAVRAGGDVPRLAAGLPTQAGDRPRDAEPV